MSQVAQQRSRPSEIRITGLGLGYVALAVVVTLAATNTGNNGLFLVLALMLAYLALSGLISRWNVRGLAARLEAPAEIYANRPTFLNFEVVNQSRWLPHWFLQVSTDTQERARLVPLLPRAGRSRGTLELLARRRGRHRIDGVRIASPFPFGLFRKGQTYRVKLDLLVYPEVFEAGGQNPGGQGFAGDQGGREAGRGHELRQLRSFRPGDDPRSIHWKQSAKSGSLIFVEREREQGRRVAILFDNGVGNLGAEAERRFEKLVSEAATAAADLLDRGFEVELVTRDGRLPFATGPRQYHAVLEALALVETCPPASAPLVSSDPRAPELRLALDRLREGSR